MFGVSTLTVHFIVHYNACFGHHQPTAKYQVDRGDCRNREACVIGGSDMGSTGATWEGRVSVKKARQERGAYVSRLSRPAGSYADTAWVCWSEIRWRIPSMVDWFSMSRS